MIELEFAQALETPFKKFQYSFSFAPEIEENSFSPHQMNGDAHVKIEYFVDYDSVLHLKGTIRIPFKFVCDRCGSNFEKNLFLEFDEKVAPNMSEEEELSYNMPVVNIDQIVSTFIILNFPTKVLCNEQCKGLCETCGANLNDMDCDCLNNKVGENNPFASLLNKFD